jgi:hypothetical protein
MQVKRGVQDNIFYSYNPKVAIKMPFDYNLISNTTENSSQTYMYEPGSFPMNANNYIFRNHSSNIVINISFIKSYANTYWLTDQNKGIKSLLLSGYEKHNGKRSQFAIFPYKEKDQNCYLVKKLSYVPLVMSQEMLNIVYFKLVTCDGYSCDQWFQAQGLSSKAQKQLDKFKKEADKNMEFIDFDQVEFQTTTLD